MSVHDRLLICRQRWVPLEGMPVLPNPRRIRTRPGYMEVGWTMISSAGVELLDRHPIFADERPGGKGRLRQPSVLLGSWARQSVPRWKRPDGRSPGKPIPPPDILRRNPSLLMQFTPG
jgi:hypothetical protein